MKHGKPRPQVTIKFAQTLDGKIADLQGNSKWISGLESRRFAHKLRSQHNAVLVGVNTVIKDNPRLNVRLVQGKNPIKVVLDSRLRIPLSAKVLKESPKKTIVVSTKSANPVKIRRIEKLGAKVLISKSNAKARIDLPDALFQLKRLGVRSILVEGGREVITAFLKYRLVDRLVIITAPKILGKGIDGIRSGVQTTPLENAKVFQLGEDIVVDASLTQ